MSSSLSTANVETFSSSIDESHSIALSNYLVPAGRALFAAIFIASGFGHFSQQTISYAAQQGIPLAPITVPLSGLIALAGGLSVLLGFHGRIGAALLVLFLVPVTFTMHAFWTVQDPMMAQIQQAMFMKNLSMLGGALLIAHFGAGPLSLDARRAGRARRSTVHAAQGARHAK